MGMQFSLRSLINTVLFYVALMGSYLIYAEVTRGMGFPSIFMAIALLGLELAITVVAAIVIEHVLLGALVIFLFHASLAAYDLTNTEAHLSDFAAILIIGSVVHFLVFATFAWFLKKSSTRH
jgi:hypothetical protein